MEPIGRLVGNKMAPGIEMLWVLFRRGDNLARVQVFQLPVLLPEVAAVFLQASVAIADVLFSDPYPIS